MKQIILPALAQVILLFVGCASVLPDEPDYASGSIIEIEKKDLGGNGPIIGTLEALSLIEGDLARQIFSYALLSSSGQAAAYLTTEDFQFEISSDELDRVVWDIGGQTLHIEKDGQRGAVLKEIVTWVGSEPIRFVTNTVLYPKDGLKKDRFDFSEQGYFIGYRGKQVEEADFKGEIGVTFQVAGFQELSLPGEGKVRAVRIGLQLELDFDEATELVPEAPKISKLSMSSLIWFQKNAPLLITQRITGARGPVRVKVLQTVARLKRDE
jgi:hypothetical protein